MVSVAIATGMLGLQGPNFQSWLFTLSSRVPSIDCRDERLFWVSGAFFVFLRGIDERTIDHREVTMLWPPEQKQMNP